MSTLAVALETRSRDFGVLQTNVRYNKICGNLRSLIHRISLLPAQDPFRQQKEAEMLNKLYDMGILGEYGLMGGVQA